MGGSRSKAHGVNTFQFTDAIKTWIHPESGVEWLLLRLMGYGFFQTKMRNRWIRLYKKGEIHYEDTINFLKYIRWRANVMNPHYGEYSPKNPEKSKRLLEEILERLGAGEHHAESSSTASSDDPSQDS